MDTLRAWILATWQYDLSLIFPFGVIILAETAFPRAGADVSWRARLKAGGFWLAWTPFTVAILLAVQPLWGQLGVRPLLGDLSPVLLPRPAAIVIGALATAFVGDFFYYWCHRAQHRFLWRFHAVHHSVREMHGMAAYHHITEEAMKLALYSAPAALLINDPFGIPVFGAVLGVQGYYLHSATRLHLGPLGRIIQDNRFHRIHHSLEPKHFDKNFGVFTTLWDSLFGTAWFPTEGEWPATGLSEAPEPGSLADFYLQPFRRRAQAADHPEGAVRAAELQS